MWRTAVAPGCYLPAARDRHKLSQNTSHVLCLLEGQHGWTGDSREDRCPPSVVDQPACEPASCGKSSGACRPVMTTLVTTCRRQQSGHPTRWLTTRQQKPLCYASQHACAAARFSRHDGRHALRLQACASICLHGGRFPIIGSTREVHPVPQGVRQINVYPLLHGGGTPLRLGRMSTSAVGPWPPPHTTHHRAKVRVVPMGHMP